MKTGDSLTFKQKTQLQQAQMMHQAGRLAEAGATYSRLLRYFPDNFQLLTGLGTIALQQGNLDESVRLLRLSLQAEPDQPLTLSNLGVACKRLSHLDEALTCYDRAIALKPDYVEAYNNRGNILKNLRRPDEALRDYNRAIALRPDYAAGHWNKAFIKLLMGDYAEGWQLYEWGWRSGDRGTARSFPQPLWLGQETLQGKTLLIHAEQGLGDFIQFCRYAPMVEALDARVIIEAPSSLLALTSTLGGDFMLVEKGQPLPAFDLHCPVMSLPLAFKTTLDTVPASIPYLHAAPAKRETWRQRLGEKKCPRIGLAWSGNPAHTNDYNRSLSLHALAPLLQLPLEFHALQKDLRPDDASALSASGQVHLHHQALRDFSDTAALVQEMDLIISVDTSLAHLAGALGHPVWILLPHAPDYRWLLDRTDSPWYPSATLFRQPFIGDWASVIATLEKRLNEMGNC